MQSEKSSVLCCASSTLFVFVSCTLTIVARLLEASLVLYRARANSNPYKMVFKVLNFVGRYKHPLRHSAFTYCGAEDPSRFDFAKERYGGPFTMKQVEDVKSFFFFQDVCYTVCDRASFLFGNSS